MALEDYAWLFQWYLYQYCLDNSSEMRLLQCNRMANQFLNSLVQLASLQVRKKFLFVFSDILYWF